MEQWNVLVNGRTHEIIFEGGTLLGKGKLGLTISRCAVRLFW